MEKPEVRSSKSETSLNVRKIRTVENERDVWIIEALNFESCFEIRISNLEF
jgi:hypothetical protein